MFDDYDDYLTVPHCAARLRCSEQRVMELVQKRVLKSFWDGVLWVQPGLISGWTT